MVLKAKPVAQLAAVRGKRETSHESHVAVDPGLGHHLRAVFQAYRQQLRLRIFGLPGHWCPARLHNSLPSAGQPPGPRPADAAALAGPVLSTCLAGSAAAGRVSACRRWTPGKGDGSPGTGTSCPDTITDANLAGDLALRTTQSDGPGVDRYPGLGPWAWTGELPVPPAVVDGAAGGCGVVVSTRGLPPPVREAGRRVRFPPGNERGRRGLQSRTQARPAVRLGGPGTSAGADAAGRAPVPRAAAGRGGRSNCGLFRRGRFPLRRLCSRRCWACSPVRAGFLEMRSCRFWLPGGNRRWPGPGRCTQSGSGRAGNTTAPVPEIPGSISQTPPGPGRTARPGTGPPPDNTLKRRVVSRGSQVAVATSAKSSRARL